MRRKRIAIENPRHQCIDFYQKKKEKESKGTDRVQKRSGLGARPSCLYHGGVMYQSPQPTSLSMFEIIRWYHVHTVVTR